MAQRLACTKYSINVNCDGNDPDEDDDDGQDHLNPRLTLTEQPYVSMNCPGQPVVPRRPLRVIGEQ